MTDIDIFFGSFLVAIPVHELGHFIAARTLGLSPRILNIGVGRVILTFQCFEARVTIRALPLNGYVACLSDSSRRPVRWAIVLLAGAAANIFTTVLCAVVSMLWPRTSSICRDIAASQTSTAMLAIIPMPVNVRGVRTGSDGLQFIRLLRRPKDDTFAVAYNAVMRQVVPDCGVALQPSVGAGELLFQITRTDRYEEAWARRDATTSLRSLIETAYLTAPETLWALDALVSSELTNRDTGATSAELDVWSMQALARATNEVTLVARAGVLVMLGRPQEARLMLLPFVNSPISSMNIAASRVIMAQAVALLGDFSEGQRLIAEAQEAVSGDAYAAMVVEKLARHVNGP